MLVSAQVSKRTLFDVGRAIFFCTAAMMSFTFYIRGRAKHSAADHPDRGCPHRADTLSEINAEGQIRKMEQSVGGVSGVRMEYLVCVALDRFSIFLCMKVFAKACGNFIHIFSGIRYVS